MKKLKINPVLDVLIEKTENGEIEWEDIGNGYAATVEGAECKIEQSVIPGSNYLFSVLTEEAVEPRGFRNGKVIELYDAIEEKRKPDEHRFES